MEQNIQIFKDLKDVILDDKYNFNKHLYKRLDKTQRGQIVKTLKDIWNSEYPTNKIGSICCGSALVNMIVKLKKRFEL